MQIEEDAGPGNSGNLWNFGMAFIGEAVPSMRLSAQMLQKLLLEGILDQVGIYVGTQFQFCNMATLLTSQADGKARNAVAEVIWRMVLATHPPVTEEAATTYLSAMTRWGNPVRLT